MAPSAHAVDDNRRQENIKQFSSTARNLARRIALQPADEDDLVQEGLFALDRALLRTTTPRHQGAFAVAVMRRAMWRYNLQPWVRDSNQTVSLEGTESGLAPLTEFVDLQLDGVPYHVQQERQLTEQAYYTGLERAHGPEARRIAENLVEPRDEKLCEYLEHAVAGVLAQQKQGPCEVCECVHRPRVRLSKTQIRRGLGITYEKWYATLNHIKAYTASWLTTHQVTLPAGVPGERRTRPR